MPFISSKTEALRPRLAALETRFDAWRRRLKARLGLMKPLHVQTYRTYAGPDSLWLRGRVLEDKNLGGGGPDASIWKNIRDAFHRYESDELPGARVEIDLGKRRAELITDEEGFYDLRLEDLEGIELTSPWSHFKVRLVGPLVDGQEPAESEARVLVPEAGADFGVVSDMDDTVIRTGATNILRRLRVELFYNATTREPFPGVDAFYQALSRGGHNPFFYVSSSAWNLFDLFEDFLDHHEIPSGPILLKEMGLDEQRWFKGGHDDYKGERIGAILDTYPDLPFILVGDSGQRDPFIYEKVVADHPGRILAIYIRDVAGQARGQEVREISRRLAERGVDLLLMEDCGGAARHARGKGWLDDEAVRRVEEAVRDAQ